MGWAGHVVGMRKKINSINVVVENPEGKKPIGRLRRRCIYAIKTAHK
jgi:hypothetical protein